MSLWDKKKKTFNNTYKRNMIKGRVHTNKSCSVLLNSWSKRGLLCNSQKCVYSDIYALLFCFVFYPWKKSPCNELFLNSHINYRNLTKAAWIIGWKRQTALILPPQFLWVWISAAALTHFNTLLSLSPVSSQEVSRSIFVDFFFSSFNSDLI